MKNASALRVTGELSLFFSVLSQLRYFEEYSPLTGIFLLLSAAALFVSVRMKNAMLRVLPVLLPGLVLLRAGTVTGAVLFGLPLLWLVITAAVPKYGISHWEYCRIFRVTMWAGLIAGGLGCARGLVWPVLFSGIFLLSGVISLRSVRMGSEMSYRWRGMNAGCVLLPLAIGGAASALFYALLRAVLVLVTVLMIPGVAGILAVQEGMGRFTQFLYNRVDGQASRAEESMASTEAATKALGDAPRTDASLPQWMESLRMDRLTVLILLIMAAAAVLIYLLVRRHRAEEAVGNIFYEEGLRSGVRRKRRPGQEKDRGNAGKIRRIYREYMELLASRGVAAEKDTTSGELLRRSEGIFNSGADADLRSLYLRARYGRGDGITDNEVKAAGEFLQELRKQAEQ